MRWSPAEPSSAVRHLARPLSQRRVADLHDLEHGHEATIAHRSAIIPDRSVEQSRARRSTWRGRDNVLSLGRTAGRRRGERNAVQDVALARLDLVEPVVRHHLAQDDEAADDHRRARGLEAGTRSRSASRSDARSASTRLRGSLA